MSPWELLGWVAACCASILCVAATVGVVVGIASADYSRKPKPAPPSGPTPPGGALGPRAVR